MAKKGKSWDDSNESAEGRTATAVPVNVDLPFVSQQGNVLSCTMGNWTEEPDNYLYQWQVGGTPVGDDTNAYAPTTDEIGTTISCVVTAVNAFGQTDAESNSIVIAAFEVPVDMDEIKTYEVIEDNTVIEGDEGVEVVYNKGDTAQISMKRARELIDSGVRIVGTD